MHVSTSQFRVICYQVIYFRNVHKECGKLKRQPERTLLLNGAICERSGVAVWLLVNQYETSDSLGTYTHFIYKGEKVTQLDVVSEAN